LLPLGREKIFVTASDGQLSLLRNAREIGTVPFLVDDPLGSTQALDVGLSITLTLDGNFSALFDYFSLTISP
jgi:hypothetical protein